MREMKEAVVVDAIRSPVGRSGWKASAKKGEFYYSNAHELASQVLLKLVDRVGKRSPEFEPEMIEDIAWGCSAQFAEQGGNLGRIAVLVADLPNCIAGQTIDRYCNAGLQAINSQAMAIMTGCGDIMVAGGTEFLSKYPIGSSILAVRGDIKNPRKTKLHRNFIKKTVNMGTAAELIAEKWELSREHLDQFGAWSHRKAVEAMRNENWYKKRICPIEVIEHDPNTDKPLRDENGKKKKKLIKKDETPRELYVDNPEKAMKKIKSLKPRFKSNGVVTAGNSSAIVDGTAAVMLMSREKANELGLKPMAVIRSMAVAGTDPILMLEGPIPAQEKALARASMTMEEMDIIEPNEAFASPCLAFAKHFEYDFLDPRVNPSGGGISIGHPIGCSGVLYFTEMIWELIRQNKTWGIQTLCGGGGVGIATIVENEKRFKA
ncbi:MAG: acetyl-CoA C-acyltransferase [Candidatus Lokiarchaeota archaeon]|nr:acetyl-CoA C-acyltransferase [Candidatus Lokiarchaeota archaeon]